MKIKDVNPEDVKVYFEDKVLEGFPANKYQVTAEVAKIPLKVAKVNQLATMPKYAHEGDAGFDLFSVSAKTIHPGETVVIKTGIAMQIPRGYEVQIRPRSGLSLKTKIRIANSPGTIDSIYRGEVGIIIENTGNKNLHVDIGDKIAQGVLKKQPVAQFIEVDELGKSDRGEDGYGSTGMKG